jgi:hypothetical protein
MFVMSYANKNKSPHVDERLLGLLKHLEQVVRERVSVLVQETERLQGTARSQRKRPCARDWNVSYVVAHAAGVVNDNELLRVLENLLVVLRLLVRLPNSATTRR